MSVKALLKQLDDKILNDSFRADELSSLELLCEIAKELPNINSLYEDMEGLSRDFYVTAIATLIYALQDTLTKGFAAKEKSEEVVGTEITESSD